MTLNSHGDYVERLRKLKLRHKELLSSQRINHHNFLLKLETADHYLFVEKKTGRILDIRY